LDSIRGVVADAGDPADFYRFPPYLFTRLPGPVLCNDAGVALGLFELACTPCTGPHGFFEKRRLLLLRSRQGSAPQNFMLEIWRLPCPAKNYAARRARFAAVEKIVKGIKG
jgi:hypothetical protein